MHAPRQAPAVESEALPSFAARLLTRCSPDGVSSTATCCAERWPHSRNRAPARVDGMGVPTVQHEALLMLLRHRPALAAELLSEVLEIELPRWREARVSTAELSDLQPAPYRADLVVLLGAKKAVQAIVVEVPLRPKPQKRLRWPQYLASLRAEHGCPCCLLVIAPTAAMARWCAKPIEMGHPGFVLQPVVLGPDAVPVVVDDAKARSCPELAVLSAMAHGRSERGVEVARAALVGADGLDDERAWLYHDLVVMSLDRAARAALEEIMEVGDYEVRSEFGKRYMAKGMAKGRAEGKAEAVLTVLRARGITVTAKVERRVQGCADMTQLDEWLARAATVESLDELFD